jgi:hypothetical protein
MYACVYTYMYACVYTYVYANVFWTLLLNHGNRKDGVKTAKLLGYTKMPTYKTDAELNT